MRKTNTFLAIFLFVIAVYGQSSQTNALISVNVRANYPSKDLVLQDFMDIEYIILETTNEFLNRGFVEDIGNNIIVVTNRRDGDIFIYSRSGKGLRKINHMGRGSGEYTNISGVILDEDNNEIFVNEEYSKIMHVYDLNGKYKRSLRHMEDTRYGSIFNFNKENLICHDFNFSSTDAAKQPFFIISKQNGIIVKDVQINFERKVSPFVTFANGSGRAVVVFLPIIPYRDGWILTETSSNTIYIFSHDYKMNPLITRTPSIQSMNPEIFLFPRMITDRYYFMETVKKEFDFEKRPGFPKTHLVYDRQAKSIHEYTLRNSDYSNKKTIVLSEGGGKPLNSEIAFWQTLGADILVEAYKKGELRGKLKEVAAELEEDSNPVIMIVKYKR